MSLSFGSTWSEFTRRIFINAPITETYRAWAIQGNMEKWFLKRAQFFDSRGNARNAGESIESGDTYEWQWYTWPEFDQKGQVTELITNESIAFDFKPAGNVQIDFERVNDNRTQVILKQFEIPTDEESKKSFFYGCSLGWSFWLVNLKAYLEHGIVLDEREVLFDGHRRLEVVNH